ncbi:GNAT family N-acetyltransferase [Marinomonas sp.]
MVTWHNHTFNELTVQRLYDLLKIRCDVFVVEQNCPYPELDGIDTLNDTQHLYALADQDAVAYARIMAPDVCYEGHVAIGRVLVTAEYRQAKLGHQLIEQAIAQANKLWPKQPIKISAQAHLANFYQRHGFEVVSSPYLEDGIEHVAMIRPTQD